MARKTDTQLLTEAGVIKNETAAAANTAVRVGEMLEDIIDSKGANYLVYTGLVTQKFPSNIVTLGSPTPLAIGVTYTINVLEFGDDFTNVGAVTNTVGESFTATGTTPTQWTFSELIFDEGAPEIVILENNIPDSLYWQVGSDGTYYLKSNSNTFTAGKCIVFMQGAVYSTGNTISLTYGWNNETTIVIQTAMNGNLNRNLMEKSSFELRIYQ